MGSLNPHPTISFAQLSSNSDWFTAWLRGRLVSPTFLLQINWIWVSGGRKWNFYKSNFVPYTALKPGLCVTASFSYLLFPNTPHAGMPCLESPLLPASHTIPNMARRSHPMVLQILAPAWKKQILLIPSISIIPTVIHIQATQVLLCLTNSSFKIHLKVTTSGKPSPLRACSFSMYMWPQQCPCPVPLQYFVYSWCFINVWFHR